MVSSALGMELGELLEALTRVGRDSAADPDYQALRRRLPADWPF
jgi:hypothetical protein